ncbi:hypothetical protein GOHSU_02_01810 [Gordonia hirsuta DSM 44140 = NBRC 16056]|uniref:Uncharacterized protein n=1 Tax=Gordonia hirsuta DSM 44140 = NBRC 16056 TaxID=1121927 RepID=L7L4H8_9ACTN|nr:hypothetical protein [Gordonia hirsuta]GAC56035.1 hypothetical protein GOHSU_02_01810 [Gordonia hirsuta DSM 44140 = NBRC 16056]
MPDSVDPDEHDDVPAADAPVKAVEAVEGSEVSAAEVSRRAVIGGAIARSLEVTGRGLRLLVFAIASVAALIGLVAMVAGVLAWRHAEHWRLPVGVIVVVLLCLPAVALPFLVHRRLAPITRAIEHPEHLARQAVDYVGDVRSGTELKDLAGLATGGRTSFWRLGSLWQATRLITALTARVTPDAQRQPLLAAFMPVSLRTLWLALIVTLWALAVAVVVLGGSLIAVLAGWTPTG